MFERRFTSGGLVLNESVQALGLEICRFLLQQSAFGHIRAIGKIGRHRDANQ